MPVAGEILALHADVVPTEAALPALDTAAPGTSVDHLPAGTWIVAGLFTVSGVVHLVRPAVFEPLMPEALGDPTPWIVGSGLAELASAAGLITRSRWAPTVAAVTLVVIWVGNVQHAVGIQRSARTSTAQKAIGWVRLPLQVPLIRWALASPVRAD